MKIKIILLVSLYLNINVVDKEDSIKNYNIEFELVKFINNKGKTSTYETDILNSFYIGNIEDSKLSKKIKIHYDLSTNIILIADKSKYEYGIDCDDTIDCEIIGKEKIIKIKYFTKEIEIKYIEAKMYMNFKENINSKNKIKTKFFLGLNMNELEYNILGWNNDSLIWESLFKNNNLKKFYLDFTYNKFIFKSSESKNESNKNYIKNNYKSNINLVENLHHIKSDLIFSKVVNINNNFTIKDTKINMVKDNIKSNLFKGNVCIDNNINLFFITNRYKIINKNLKKSICTDEKKCNFDENLKDIYDLFGINFIISGYEKDNLYGSDSFFIEENGLTYLNYITDKRGKIDINFNKNQKINKIYNKNCNIILGNLFFKLYSPIIKKIYDEKNNRIDTFISFKKGIVRMNNKREILILITLFIILFILFVIMLLVTKKLVIFTNKLYDEEEIQN